MIFIHIPVPFERGDLLEYRGKPYVLSCLVHCLNGSSYEGMLSGKYVADGSDMTGWFYSISCEGQLISDDGIPYYELHFFRGELKGQDRFLEYLSLSMKKQSPYPFPDIEALMCVFHKFKVHAEYEKAIRFRHRFVPLDEWGKGS